MSSALFFFLFKSQTLTRFEIRDVSAHSARKRSENGSLNQKEEIWKLLAWSKRDPPSSTHRPSEEEEKAAGKSMVNGSWSKNQMVLRNIRECMVIIQFCRWK
ncbi:hypothetical protein CEXT_538321 [Caerostris extrusa]|uniref:Uncharacterized protein n=1 Tax=Caerostris extrusa TaxID=172846 RepID=A0AAV4NWW3_CAEEX|nr:hypothetical protein CEXT_538321 [Caerostris extrusa]